MSGHRGRRTVAVRRLLRSTRLRAALALGTVLAVGATGTWAYWTDSATVGGITVSTGSLDLKLNGQDNLTGYTSLNISNMVPGNSVAAVITVQNAANLAFTYTATSSATNADGKNLAGALAVKVTGDATVTGTAPNQTCAGTALAGSGTTLGGSLIGTARPLAGNASEPICVQLTLPTNAATTVQGATTNITLTFNATQS